MDTFFEWKNINYTVRAKDCNNNAVDRKILNNLNGAAQSGELMAVLGQSGSGKTSFLNALSFRIPYKRSSLLTGSVLLNGKQMNGRKMAKVSAFVEQESFLFNYLVSALGF